MLARLLGDDELGCAACGAKMDTSENEQADGTDSTSAAAEGFGFGHGTGQKSPGC